MGRWERLTLRRLVGRFRGMGYREFFTQYPIARALIAAGLAAIFASFACVVFERVPKGKSLNGRSFCICGAVIKPWYNIPIFGWLIQGGKAKCCGARIPIGYFLAEVVSAVFAGVTFYLLPFWQSLVMSVAVVVAVGAQSAREGRSSKDRKTDGVGVDGGAAAQVDPTERG